MQAQCNLKMEKKKTNGAINSIKEFFVQTFRRHSGEEYSELVTRGMSDKTGNNKKYPWAYVRLFTLCLILFAVFILIVRFTSNQLFIPTITAFGSLLFNVPFLLFIYELYPKRDISFMGVVLALLLGGAMASVLAQILYNLFPPADDWLRAVYAGFFEELPKAAATITIIIVARKNSPMAGFLLGAAVGCGFSIAEDMGYIFSQANELPVMNLVTIIQVTMTRGVTAFCTHTLWTALIGWAYCHFSRHFANVMFYLVTLFACGIHIVWDLPLGLVAGTLANVGCGIVVAVICIVIVHVERKKVFAERALQPEDLGNNGIAAEGNGSAVAEAAVQEAPEEAEEQTEKTTNKKDPLYWRHGGHLAITVGAFLMAVVAIIYCSIPFRETYAAEKFVTPVSFVSFMQNGREFNYTENRAYNSHDTVNDVTYEENGKLTRVIQREKDATDESMTYNYEYSVSYDVVSDRYYYFPVSVSVTVSDVNGEMTYYKEDVYNDGKLYASFFRLNSDVTGFYFDSKGTVTVFIYNADFVRDLTEWQYLSLFCVFAATFALSMMCYIALEIKSWRVKKQCLTETASSAE